MFVSNDDYPFFREPPARSYTKKNRFKLEKFQNTFSKSQEFILSEENQPKTDKSRTEKKLKKHLFKAPANLLDSINEFNKTEDLNKNAFELTEEKLSTLIRYKKLENANKANPIFHLPPIVTKPADPETTFLTFGELDEINDRILQKGQFSSLSGKKNKGLKGDNLNLELTYNKTQFQKFQTICNEEELSSFKHLFQNISKHKLKESKTPKIKMYSSQALFSDGNSSSNLFTEFQLPQNEKEKAKEKETEKEKEIEKKKDKFKRTVNNYDNLYFESSIYFYSYEQNGWRPEIRELCTMILYEKKLFIYSGIGRNIMDDITAADLGFFFKNIKKII